MSRACSDEWLRANEGEKLYDDESECGGGQERWSNVPMVVLLICGESTVWCRGCCSMRNYSRRSIGSKTWGFATL